MPRHDIILPGLPDLGNNAERERVDVTAAARKREFRTTDFTGTFETRQPSVGDWTTLTAALGEHTGEEQRKLIHDFDQRGVRDPEDIPAGVTYLLQMLAHDVVMSVRAAAGSRLPLTNAVERPLVLQSLYGAGPNAAPHLFAPEKNFFSGRFQLNHRTPDTPPETDFFRERVVGHVLARNAVLADARSDSNAFVSQLVVLWMRFHNAVLDRIDVEARPHRELLETDSEARLEQRYRMARGVVQRSWLNVIGQDILTRLLDPSPAPYRGSSDDGRVNVDLSHAALRVFHSMPLVRYHLRDGLTNRTLADGLGDGANKPERLDFANWGIDWQHFFDDGSVLARNRTRIFIGPNEVLEGKATGLEDAHPLAAIDYLREARMGTIAVRDIDRIYCDALRPDLAPGAREATISTILTERSVPADIASRVAAAPPVALFLQIEAHLAHGGRRLGPIGSALVAGPLKRFAANAETEAIADDFAGSDALIASDMAELLRRLA